MSSPASYANAAVVALGLIFGAFGAKERAAEAPVERPLLAGDHRAPGEQPDAGRADLALLGEG